jgi:hypothetical protein
MNEIRPDLAQHNPVGNLDHTQPVQQHPGVDLVEVFGLVIPSDARAAEPELRADFVFDFDLVIVFEFLFKIVVEIIVEVIVVDIIEVLELVVAAVIRQPFGVTEIVIVVLEP